MSLRTKSKVAKALKENSVRESKSALHNKVSKSGRKVLADISNSSSDNNTSIEVKKKVSTKVIVEKNCRPRRDRRLPTRLVENQVLSNLPNSKDSVIPFVESSEKLQCNILNKNKIQTKQESKLKHSKNGNQENNQPQQRKIYPQRSETLNNDTPLKCDKSTHSPFQTLTNLESCVSSHPKRIHRLPSRFEEHSMSPSKFLPLVPKFASTPLQQKNKSSIIESKSYTKKSNSSNKSSPDTNNNPKKIRAARQNIDFKKFFSPSNATLKSKNHVEKVGKNNRIPNKSQSFKVLEEKQSKKNHDAVDVYEFTYDPDEEPPQKKKKKKRVVKKNPAKPKFIIFNNNYEQNLSRTLNKLKKVVSNNIKTTKNSQKSSSSDGQNNNMENPSIKNIQPINNFIDKTMQSCPTNAAIRQNGEHTDLSAQSIVRNNKLVTNLITHQQPTTISTKYKETTNITPKKPLCNVKNLEHENNFASIRIDDIAADFVLSDNCDDINYSPVNSPIRPVTPNNQDLAGNVNFHSEQRNKTIESAVNNPDPLNLQGNISFFKEQPAASSSINMSVKHPLANPWRVEFENLPIKWPVNTYVKPNMTPSVESSFISSKDDNNKKLIYTNMLLQSNEMLPESVDDYTSHLKQASIISFMKEVAEKSASKKKRALSVTPKKANSLFEDITNNSFFKNRNSAQEIGKKDGNVLIQNKKASNDKENIRNNRKRKNEDNIEAVHAKSPCRQMDKDFTCFGFDDSENLGNLENTSPKKIDSRVLAFRSRARAVLQEIKGQVGPTRADMPLAAKSNTITSKEAVNKMYIDVKPAQVAPTFENRNNIQKHTEATTVHSMLHENTDNADSNSVHLFEDIELIHHLKPKRKSYGKAKKVTFRQNSISDDDTQDSNETRHSEVSDVDDLGDLTFTMPVISKKKPIKKNKTKSQLSIKEKKEMNTWAAGFNSMCEDIDKFQLVME